MTETELVFTGRTRKHSQSVETLKCKKSEENVKTFKGEKNPDFISRVGNGAGEGEAGAQLRIQY